MRRIDPSLLVVLGGVSAALHVGKLPPALPALQQALGVSLLQAGFLLSVVQLAGMALGLVVGLAADGLGLKRTMVAGLSLLSGSSFFGGWAGDPYSLMVLRAVEGFGFLLASMPAPALIRRLVDPALMSRTLGIWGAYMPFGTAVALVGGPPLIAAAGWQGWWWLLATLSAAAAIWLAVALPGDGLPPFRAGRGESWMLRVRLTLSTAGPWLVALAFAVYSAQWLAVIGFLPSMYSQAGLAPTLVGVATGFAAAVNIVGNIASGRLLHRGIPPERLLYAGFAAMAVGGFVAFAPVTAWFDPVYAAGSRYGAVLLFSAAGGLIPGTLFSLAVQLAPGEGTVSTTVGWMQQWSAAGQLAGPPLVAWVATIAGGWQWSWVVTCGCALMGLGLAFMLRQVQARALILERKIKARTND